MVKQQMYLPTNGGPPVPVRGTPPRKVKKKTPTPRRASLAAPPQLSSGATMTRRSTIATTGRPLVAPLQLPNGPKRRNTIATAARLATIATATVTTAAVSGPAVVKPRASTSATAAAKTAPAQPTTITAPAPISAAKGTPISVPLAHVPAPAEPTPVAPPTTPPTASIIVPVALDPATAPLAMQSRQRRNRSISLAQCMEPYEGLTSFVLRQECKRRGISIYKKTNGDMRHKIGFMKLLREDDLRRAAQDASAAIHKQDLEQLQLGTFPATQSSAQASASPSTLTPASSYSFLSPSALMPTPASAAAATAAVLYPPLATAAVFYPPVATAAELYPPAALMNHIPAQPSPVPVSRDVPVPAAATSNLAAMPKLKAKSKAKAVIPPPPTRSIRPRRGCYFRLINVLLTPEFNVRWREMNDKIADSDTNADVNQFWLDVHVAYMSVNQLFDGLHFHDALFKNADPSVILAHEASRLRQMWIEVVAKYQKAVADSKKPSLQAETGGSDDDETQSFYDSCGKRLDLLYLHMGLLLEPELSEFVLNMAPPSGSSASQRPLPVKSVVKPAATTTSPLGIQKIVTTTAAAGKKRASMSSSTSKRPMKPRASLTPPPMRKRASSFTMSTPPPQPTLPFSPVRSTGPAIGTNFVHYKDTSAAKPDADPQLYALVVSGELRDSAFETFAPHTFGDDGSGSSDYDSELPTRALAPRKRRRRSSELSNDIIELTSSALVPHQSSNNTSNRMHHTALTTRPAPGSELMLPPDEWVILENRLRKVSESLDRCHRALSGSEGQVSEIHRQSLESDLRFYSAIKQRLQEQLLMVMQGF